jgi:cobalt-zinc-cadmium efflux system membrane fusion protein
MQKIILFTGIAMLLFSCASKQPATETNTVTWQGDTITVPPGSNLGSKLKLHTVQSQPYKLQMLTAGTVRAIPTQYAEIAPPFPGRILRSFTKLGMRVNPETPLFEISSPDFMEAQKQYFQARSQYELALQTMKRQQDLMKHGVTSQKDLEEAATAFEIAKKEYENAVISIRLFKANPDQLSLGQPLIVRSPIAGEVLDNRIVVGQFLKGDAASVATVAELSTVWVVGQVKEKDIRFIRALDECTIELAAFPEKTIPGKVYHVKEMIDEATRSVEVLIGCNNGDHTLKPGMYVTVNFRDAPVNTILVPAKAILQMNDQSFVFTAIAPGTYKKQPVEVGGSEGDKVVIRSGLMNGDQIIAEGGFYLLEAK